MRVIVYFVLAWAITWTITAPLYVPALRALALPLNIHHALGALGPPLAALILTAATEGPAGIRRLLGRVVALPRQRWVVLLGLLTPFVLLGIAVAIAASLGRPMSGLMHSPDYPGLNPIGLFTFYLLSFGLCEELGWRGYALPHLQRRWSPLVATLVLSLGWALWHLPMFFYWPSMMGLGFGGVVGWLVSLILGALILTWLYNKSGGSLLPVILFHAAINTVFATDQPGGVAPMIIGMLVTFVGVGAGVALWRSPRTTLAPA